ncbi:MAG: type II toxin-antitoxin system VapC family toxin [Angustibacter sp.]
MPEFSRALVVDASVLVDLLADTELAPAARARLTGQELHAPAHVDAEVLSALGRLQRAGVLSVRRVSRCVELQRDAAVQRHGLGPLMAGAWARRDRLRLTDSLYVELAEQLQVPLLTTDGRLARAYSRAEVMP